MKTLLDLEPGDCRFPFETEDGWRFCSKPKHVYLRDGKVCQSSWCSDHHLICTYVPAQKQRSAA